MIFALASPTTLIISSVDASLMRFTLLNSFSRVFLVFSPIPFISSKAEATCRLLRLSRWKVMANPAGRSVRVPDEKSGAKLMGRCERIALEAMKQCGRSKKMKLGGILGFDEMVRRVKEHELALLAYEASESSLHNAMCDADDIALIIGPEGGFEEAEAETLREAGAREVSLGKRILRAETAAIAFCAVSI